MLRLAGWEAGPDRPARCAIGVILSTESGDVPIERWQVLAEEVLAWNCDARSPPGRGRVEPLLHHVDHPVLWPFAPERHQLFFRGDVADPGAVAAAVIERHRRETGGWLDLDDFVNSHFVDRLAGLLAQGHGSFADGPRQLIDAYEEELRAGGYATSTIASRRWHTADGDPNGLSAVTLGSRGRNRSSAYVIASRFACRRVG